MTHAGSFKNAFFWFLNDPAWAISWPNCSDHLVLSKYAISSWSDGPNSRKWPITGWIIQNGLRVARKKISNVNQNFFGHAVFAGFSKKGCSIIKSGFRKIPYRGFPSKSAQSWKRAVFGLTSWIFEWSRFFPGKPPCTFHVLIVRNIHAKKLRNP